MAMARIEFEPEDITSASSGVSRLIVSRDVYILKSAQQPLDPFAFGGTKVIPKADASFRKTDEVWIFAELRNPSIAEDGTPHIATKTTLQGPPGTLAWHSSAESSHCHAGSLPKIAANARTPATLQTQSCPMCVAM